MIYVLGFVYSLGLDGYCGGWLYRGNVLWLLVRTDGDLNAWRIWKALGCRVLMERLKFDVVLAKQQLIVAEAVQELPLREPAPPRPRCESQYALRPRFGAVGTRKPSVTLYLALLAEHTGQHALWLLGLRGYGRRRHDYSNREAINSSCWSCPTHCRWLKSAGAARLFVSLGCSGVVGENGRGLEFGVAKIRVKVALGICYLPTEFAVTIGCDGPVSQRSRSYVRC